MAKFLINPPNFLLLDEPTTHLDVDAVEALVRALKHYEGTLIFISHDIYFVRSLANCSLEVKDGRIREFPGNFDYYLENRDKIPTPIKKQEIKEEEKEEEIDLKKAQAQRRENEKMRLRKEEKKRRKAFNASLHNKISKLKRKREALSLEADARKRAIANPHKYSDEEIIKGHKLRINQIEKKTQDIDVEIKDLREQLIA